MDPKIKVTSKYIERLFNLLRNFLDGKAPGDMR